MAKEEKLTLKVLNQFGDVIFFVVKPSTKLSAIFEAYIAKTGVSDYRFMFDGKRLKANSTPDEEDMADGDVIDANLDQTGGQ